MYNTSVRLRQSLGLEGLVLIVFARSGALVQYLSALVPALGPSFDSICTVHTLLPVVRVTQNRDNDQKIGDRLKREVDCTLFRILRSLSRFKKPNQVTSQWILQPPVLPCSLFINAWFCSTGPNSTPVPSGATSATLSRPQRDESLGPASLSRRRYTFKLVLRSVLGYGPVGVLE